MRLPHQKLIQLYSNMFEFESKLIYQTIINLN